MHTWQEDSRRYDAPGFDLNDASVSSLFQIWKVDEATRGEVKAWMETYMRQTNDATFTEIVLPNMALEVYEGFAQVVVPILQSRENSTVRIEQRQSVLYGLGAASLGG